MMDHHKRLTFGILIVIAAFPLVAHSWIDQYSPSPLRLNVTVTSIKQWLFKAGELATLGQKDDTAVAQYTWTVTNIRDRIIKAKETEVRIFSPPFYTDVPGYRLRLALDLYDSNTSYIGLYLGMVKGQFDDLVSWPFDEKYELSSAGPDGTTFVSMSVTPNEADCHRAFYRQPYSSTHTCGYGNYFDIEKLLSNKTSYLIDGSLNITVTVYFDD